MVNEIIYKIKSKDIIAVFVLKLSYESLLICHAIIVKSNQTGWSLKRYTQCRCKCGAESPSLGVKKI